MGFVGFAHAVGTIKCDAEIGLDHLYNPAGEAEEPLDSLDQLISSCGGRNFRPPRPA
jgi:hypothetical protein